jgi:hypothetical protein
MLDVFIVLGEGYIEDAFVHGFIPDRMGRDGFEKVPDTVLDLLHPL